MGHNSDREIVKYSDRGKGNKPKKEKPRKEKPKKEKDSAKIDYYDVVDGDLCETDPYDSTSNSTKRPSIRKDPTARKPERSHTKPPPVPESIPAGNTYQASPYGNPSVNPSSYATPNSYATPSSYAAPNAYGTPNAYGIPNPDGNPNSYGYATPIPYGTPNPYGNHNWHGNPNTYRNPHYQQWPPQDPMPGARVPRRPLDSRPPETRAAAKPTRDSYRDVPVHRQALGLDEFPRVNVSARNPEFPSPKPKTPRASTHTNSDQPELYTSQPKQRPESRTNPPPQQPGRSYSTYAERPGNPPADRRRTDYSSDRRTRDPSSSRRRNDPARAVDIDPYQQPSFDRDRNGREYPNAARPPSPQQPSHDQQYFRDSERGPNYNPVESGFPEKKINNKIHIIINHILVPKEKHYKRGTWPCLAYAVSRVSGDYIKTESKRFKKWFGKFHMLKIHQDDPLRPYPMPGPWGDGSHPIEPYKPHPHYDGQGVERPENGRCIAGKCFPLPHPQKVLMEHPSYWDSDLSETKPMDRCKEGWCYPPITRLLDHPPLEHREEFLWHECWCGCEAKIRWDGCLDLFCHPEMWVNDPKRKESRGAESGGGVDDGGSDSYRRVALWVESLPQPREGPEPSYYDDDEYRGRRYRERR
ncbi:hypothetical protein V8F20_010530 [Naviculisporaceae sp. PSN 640]